ncbi:MAG: hypothetical protein IJU28_10125, partial [Clostridia bacterium]|nr:hypothetical protein [Clostridia bacterium]
HGVGAAHDFRFLYHHTFHTRFCQSFFTQFDACAEGEIYQHLEKERGKSRIQSRICRVFDVSVISW